jgi:hypothetical protein
MLISMSFLFATSHLPAVKRRQINEEEEEEDNAQPMQRSGGVRAISHLEEPGRGGPSVPLSQRVVQPLGRLVQPEKPAGPGTAPADGMAAAKASGVFDLVRHQYNQGGNEHFMDEHGQLQPRNESRSQASPSPAAKRPSWADESEAHADHEPHGDADDGHSHHEVEDHRPWYLPPITHEDLHPQEGYHDDTTRAIFDRMARGVPRPNGNAPSFSHFPEHAADDAEHPDTGRHGDFESTAPADGGHNGTTGPLSPRGAAPPAGRSLFLTPRPMPPEYARQQTKAYGSAPGSPKSLADTSGSMFQQVAAKRGAQQQGARQAQSSPPAPGGRPAAQPPAQRPLAATGPAQNAHAAPQPQKQGQPPAPQKAADPGQSTAKEPAPQQQVKIDSSNPQFEATARAAMAEEAANSPMAAALQKEAARLGFSIVPQTGLKPSETLPGPDGKPVIHFNPFRKTDTTMSHEITHVIQMAAFQQYIDEVKKTGKTPDKDDLKNAIKAGRDAVNKIVPVKSDKDQGQDYKENDAMRAAYIVRAERTASEMKNLPEDQKTLEEFQRRQAEKEKVRGEKEKGSKHQNNANPIPEGTERGSYDYQYVRDTLGLDEKGKKKPKPPSATLPQTPP